MSNENCIYIQMPLRMHTHKLLQRSTSFAVGECDWIINNLIVSSLHTERFVSSRGILVNEEMNELHCRIREVRRSMGQETTTNAKLLTNDAEDGGSC